MPHDVMLIIGHKSGVIYQNQVGGTSCSEEELEGVLVPVGLKDETVENITKLTFAAPKGALATAVADAIDRLLSMDLISSYIRVDRARLADSMEAWVHVTIETPGSSDPDEVRHYYGSAFGFGNVHGILTWPNSD